MHITDLRRPLAEGSTTPIIVVDIQPAYEPHINIDVHSLAEMLNQHQGKILMLVNADREGLTQDTADSIGEWWLDAGLNPQLWRNHRMTYYDKGYGYMRAWMDAGISPAAIIRIIRVMFQQRKYDSRDLDPDLLVQTVGDEWEDWMKDDPLIVNWIGIDLLREHQGYICGGSRNECLREVTLMMNAFNLKYKIMERFVYE